METMFINVLNMSITGSYVILFVLLLRIPMKKLPKIFSYSLWGVVFFRLVSPYSFSSAFSILKYISSPSNKAGYIPRTIGLMSQPKVDVGLDGINNVINSSLPAATPYASANEMQIIIFLYSVVWILGIIITAAYSIISYMIIRKKVQAAILDQDNIYISEKIQTPFVLGIVKPKIYLPSGLSEKEKVYILKHEHTHITRLDYIVKPFAFFVLCIHWFNPLVWLSFIMMSRDMEMSCDEKVIKELGNEIKKEYSASLLSMAVNKRIISGSPLAFGETNVEKRIKNVLGFKKPSLRSVVGASCLIIVIGICLLSNPQYGKTESALKSQNYLNCRTDYVGDASKVGGIIYMLKFPDSVSYDHFELQTGNKPYGVTVYLKTGKGMLDAAMVSDYTKYQKNSLILFSLIGNADEIIYNLSDGDSSNTMQFSRNWANNSMNKDVWKISESKSAYEEFLGYIDDRFSKASVDSSETIKR